MSVSPNEVITPRNHIARGFYYLLVVAVVGFTVVMLTMVFPYMSFERALNFLGTKPDSTLDSQTFVTAFYIHITSSFIALFGGVWQFSSTIYQRYPILHRRVGMAYIVSILFLAAPSGMVLATFANGGLPAKVGFSFQCILWWLATAAAWRAIKQKNYLLHNEMMIRSYALTLAALTLRTESYMMHYLLLTKPMETYVTVTWLSWVGNLVVAECLIIAGTSKRMLLAFTKGSKNKLP